MEENLKRESTLRKVIDWQSDPESLKKFGDDIFNQAKKLSDFAGFLVRMTFLFAAGLYFLKGMVEQATLFYTVAYGVCALTFIGLSAQIYSNVFHITLNYGLRQVPRWPGIVTKSLVVSLTGALTVFLLAGSYELVKAIANTNAITRLSQ